jgi:ElaB/YqjD/DUF883 family membrane-anchored ribosome-binding protein
MNAVFTSMSDLVADAEDLLARVARSPRPQVRALEDMFQVSVHRVNEQLRARARAIRPHQASAHPSLEIPWLYIAAGACLALGIGAGLRLQRKSST